MQANAKTFEELIHLLEEESEIYGRMTELLDREREALLGLAASELGEIVSTKETLGLRVKALDESRKVLSERLGSSFGLSQDQVTVTALAAHAPAHLAPRLCLARDLLRDRAHTCKTINDYNSRAARKGLELVHSSIDFLLSEADPSEKVYHKDRGYGAMRGSTRPAVVSRQV